MEVQEADMEVQEEAVLNFADFYSFSQNIKPNAFNFLLFFIITVIKLGL